MCGNSFVTLNAVGNASECECARAHTVRFSNNILICNFYVRFNSTRCEPLKPIARVRCNMQIDHFRNFIFLRSLRSTNNQLVQFNGFQTFEINAFNEHKIDNIIIYSAFGEYTNCMRLS